MKEGNEQVGSQASGRIYSFAALGLGLASLYGAYSITDSGHRMKLQEREQLNKSSLMEVQNPEAALKVTNANLAGARVYDLESPDKKIRECKLVLGDNSATVYLKNPSKKGNRCADLRGGIDWSLIDAQNMQGVAHTFKRRAVK
jgi:hypothetical protein